MLHFCHALTVPSLERRTAPQPWQPQSRPAIGTIMICNVLESFGGGKRTTSTSVPFASMRVLPVVVGWIVILSRIHGLQVHVADGAHAATRIARYDLDVASFRLRSSSLAKVSRPLARLSNASVNGLEARHFGDLTLDGMTVRPQGGVLELRPPCFRRLGLSRNRAAPPEPSVSCPSSPRVLAGQSIRMLPVWNTLPSTLLSGPHGLPPARVSLTCGQLSSQHHRATPPSREHISTM